MRRLALVLVSVFAVFAPSAASACSTGGAVRDVTYERSVTPPGTGDVLAPGSTLTYNYRIRSVSWETPSTGSWQWKPRWVDEGSWHWHSDLRDEGYWIDGGYWVGSWVTRTTRDWVDTSHWAYSFHNNKFRFSASPVSCRIHEHDARSGDCGGHGRGFERHWNSGLFWHQTGFWGPEYQLSYYEPYHTFVPARFWQSSIVDRGSWHWHERLVDRGSMVWVSEPSGDPVAVETWEEFVRVTTPPPAQAVDVSYNYVLRRTVCALPT
jgi:hypothetical protein